MEGVTHTRGSRWYETITINAFEKNSHDVFRREYLNQDESYEAQLAYFSKGTNN